MMDAGAPHLFTSSFPSQSGLAEETLFFFFTICKNLYPFVLQIKLKSMDDKSSLFHIGWTDNSPRSSQEFPKEWDKRAGRGQISSGSGVKVRPRGNMWRETGGHTLFHPAQVWSPLRPMFSPLSHLSLTLLEIQWDGQIERATEESEWDGRAEQQAFRQLVCFWLWVLSQRNLRYTKVIFSHGVTLSLCSPEAVYLL